MNIENVNRWLSVVASIGVVIGLVVVILELNESSRQAAAATNRSRNAEIESSFRDYALSEFLPKIYVKVQTDGLSSLDGVQLERIKSWELARILRMESQFVQYQSGYLSETSYKGMLKSARKLVPLWKELGIQSRNAMFWQEVTQGVHA